MMGSQNTKKRSSLLQLETESYMIRALRIFIETNTEINMDFNNDIVKQTNRLRYGKYSDERIQMEK